MAVVRERKFADPAAPKRLPEEPLPNAAPMSAPLPCCSRTKPISVAATTRCTPTRSVSQTISSILYAPPVLFDLGTGDRQKFIRLERRTADQGTVDIRAREQGLRVVRFNAATVEQRHRRRHAIDVPEALAQQ